MSGEQKPALRKIRTYAPDAATIQGVRSDDATTTTAPSGGEDIVYPTEKAAAARTVTPPPPSEHIPAFHELKKKTAAPETIQASTPLPKINVRPKKRDLKTTVRASGGMVITDTKRAKVNLFSELIAPVNSFFAKLGSSAPRKGHTYTVTDTERRKGVIQKATSKSGSIFTADNETLREEIRRRQIEQPHAPGATPHLSWTPRTETGYPLLPGTVTAPTPERVVVEFKKASPPQPVIVEPVQEPIVMPAAVYAPPVPPTPQPAPEVILPIAVAAGPTVVEPIQIPDLPPPVVQNYVPEPKPFYPPVTRPQPNTSALTPADRLAQFIARLKANTNALTFSIAGILLLAAVATVGAQFTYRLLQNNPDNPSSSPTIALLSSATVVDLPLTELTRSGLISAMTEATEIDGIAREFRLTDSKNVSLSTSDVLILTGFSNNLNLNQTITAIHVVTINGQRGIVFSVSDSTTAFGALLTWEPSMLVTLAEFLGTEEEGSTGFIDQTIATKDVRVLSQNGTGLITYGFIDTDTVLITKDTAAFSSIVGNPE